MAVIIDDIQKEIVSDKNELSKRIAEKIGELVEEATDGLEEASDNAKEALDDFGKFIEELKSSLTDCQKIIDSTDTLDMKAWELSEISDKLSANIEENNKAANAIANEQRKIMEEMSSKMTDFSDKLKVFDTKIKGAVDQSLDKITNGTKEIDGSMDNTLKSIKEHGDRICMNANKCSSEIVGSTEKFSDIQEGLAALADKTAQINDSIEQQIDGFSASVSNGINSADNCSKVFDKTSEHAEELVKEMQMQKKKIEDILNDFSERTRQLLDSLNESERIFKDKITENGQETDRLLKEFGDKFSEAIQCFEKSSKVILSEFEEKCNDIVLQNKLVHEDVLRLEKMLKANNEALEAREQQNKKRLYVALGMMVVIVMLNVINILI